MKQENIYRISARRIKADKLADVIQAAAGTSSEAARMNEQDWSRVVFLAQVNPPSDETKQLVVEILEGREESYRRLQGQAAA